MSWGVLGETELAIDVAADPAALVVVRHVCGGMATALGFDASKASDLRLAVTEVCASFVRARPEDGPRRHGLHVAATLVEGGLRVCVTDPASPPPGPGTGPPLPLLAAITDGVELRKVPGGGMEVQMSFLLEG